MCQKGKANLSLENISIYCVRINPKVYMYSNYSGQGKNC